MKKLILISTVILIVALCGCNKQKEEELTIGTSIMAEASTETSTYGGTNAESLKADKLEEIPDYISIKEEERTDRPFGYTVQATSGGTKTYVRDPNYLVPQTSTEKGIFVSEHISDADAFLTEMLRDIISSKGKAAKKYKEYFSEEKVLSELESFNWSILGENWVEDEFYFQRDYSLFRLYGRSDYEFHYYFKPDIQKMECMEAALISITVIINEEEGTIYDLSIETRMEGETFFYVTYGDIWNDNFTELQMQDGKPVERKILLNFIEYFEKFQSSDEEYEQELKGLFIDNNAAVTAHHLGDILENILISGKQQLPKYKEFFREDMDGYNRLSEMEWEKLEEKWMIQENYDCYYVDKIRSYGCVQYDYYFYPDFNKMETENATAISLKVYLGVYNGKINAIEPYLIPISKSEYDQSRARLKEKQNNEYIIRHGEKFNNLGDTTTVDTAAFFGEALTKVINERGNNEYSFEENLGEGMSYLPLEIGDRLDENWQTTGDYDCYAIQGNAIEGYDHFRYYFYPEIKNQGKKSAMVMMEFYTKDRKIDGLEFYGVFDTVF